MVNEPSVPPLGGRLLFANLGSVCEVSVDIFQFEMSDVFR